MYERTITSTRAYIGRVLALDVFEIETDQGIRAKRDVVRRLGFIHPTSEYCDEILRLFEALVDAKPLCVWLLASLRPA